MPRAEAGARLLPLLLLAAYSLAAVQALTLAGDQLKDFIQIADRSGTIRSGTLYSSIAMYSLTARVLSVLQRRAREGASSLPPGETPPKCEYRIHIQGYGCCNYSYVCLSVGAWARLGAPASCQTTVSWLLAFWVVALAKQTPCN